MDLIYPLSYLLSLSGLVTWFLVKKNKGISRKVSAVFLIGYLVYLCALSFSSGSFEYKLLILFRDMAVMGVVSQLFNIFRRNKLLSAILAGAAALTLYFSYFNVLLFTFPQLHTAHIDTSGEFLVQIDRNGPELIDHIHKKFDCTIEPAFAPSRTTETLLDEYYIIDIKGDKPLQWKRLYRELDGHPAVGWIEPNEILTLTLPTGPASGDVEERSFLVNDPEIDRQWGFGPLDVNALHETLVKSGIKPVKIAKIAILDTGVDGGHEDITSNYASYDKSYDTDRNGHGTHCAGVAAAVSNNGIGIASLAPGTGFVEVTSYRVINAFGVGSQQSVIKGMIEAADSGADVISLSLGMRSRQKSEKAYREAVQYALDRGAVVIAAAGNNNANAKTIAPANVKGVIAVAAVNADLTKAAFSNTVGDITMAVAAPGVGIYSTLPDDKYGALTGTSMAAPCVAGTVGLMKSLYPGLTAEEAFAILSSTGREIRDHTLTGRLIQPKLAIQELMD